MGSLVVVPKEGGSKQGHTKQSLWPAPMKLVGDAAEKERPERPAPESNSAISSASYFLDDPERMKECVRQALHKPEYSTFALYHETGFWQHLAKHPIFENLTLAVITFNAVWMAVDTDLNKADTLLDAAPIFVIAENVFCIYFSGEWIIRFMAWRRKRDSLQDGWFVFDSVMVFMMVAETWVMSLFLLIASSASSGGMGNTALLRLFRLLRLSRLARMLRSMPELMILIKGMMSATKSVFFVMCLLMIILYVFAIAMTQLSMGTEMGDTLYSSVGLSMYSLMVYGTFLDNLTWMVDQIGAESYACVFVFFVFVLLSALTVLNMLIGVLCEVVSAVAETERDGLQVSFVADKMKEIMKRLDRDNDGDISKDEFLQILQDDVAISALEEVGVDTRGIVDFADFIFEAGEDDKLSFQTFMEQVLRLRRSNIIKVRDLVEMRQALPEQIQKIEKRLVYRRAEDASEATASAQEVAVSGARQELDELQRRTANVESLLGSVLDEVKLLTQCLGPAELAYSGIPAAGAVADLPPQGPPPPCEPLVPPVGLPPPLLTPAAVESPMPETLLDTRGLSGQEADGRVPPPAPLKLAPLTPLAPLAPAHIQDESLESNGLEFSKLMMTQARPLHDANSYTTNYQMTMPRPRSPAEDQDTDAQPDSTWPSPLPPPGLPGMLVDEAAKPPLPPQPQRQQELRQVAAELGLPPNIRLP